MELLSAYKELVEVLESEVPQNTIEERLVIIGQAMKTVERA